MLQNEPRRYGVYAIRQREHVSPPSSEPARRLFLKHIRSTTVVIAE